MVPGTPGAGDCRPNVRGLPDRQCPDYSVPYNSAAKMPLPIACGITENRRPRVGKVMCIGEEVCEHCGQFFGASTAAAGVRDHCVRCPHSADTVVVDLRLFGLARTRNSSRMLPARSRCRDRIECVYSFPDACTVFDLRCFGHFLCPFLFRVVYTAGVLCSAVNRPVWVSSAGDSAPCARTLADALSMTTDMWAR
jgi:hypothetical protein